MKVLCIDASGLPKDWPYTVKEGVVYHVYNTHPEDVFQHPPIANAYLIYDEEDSRHYFPKSRFVPVSDIDEAELIQQRNVNVK